MKLVMTQKVSQEVASPMHLTINGKIKVVKYDYSTETQIMVTVLILFQYKLLKSNTV